jgi:hypothetical protein
MDPLTRLRVAPWPGGAMAPLNLMIDDLADVFIPVTGCRGPERDWGHLGRGPGSAWRVVEEHLLAPFPELRISVFIPVNRQPLVEPPPGSRFHPIDQRPEMVAFLRELAAHPRVECCYHGKDHFRGQGSARDQEFRTYVSLEEAVTETRRGLELWDRVFGAPPLGGKYPGYASNEWSDEAVALFGFRWWCRRFNRSQIQSLDTPAAELTPRWLRGGALLEMPSTLAGNVLPPLLRDEWTRRPKRLLQRHRMRRVARLQWNQLCTAGLPLTIQEHIAPSREDGKRQGNNLQDDESALTWMLKALSEFPLWPAHLTEIADHLRLREFTSLELIGTELYLHAPQVDLLKTIELEVLDPRLQAFLTPDGTRRPVRDSSRGRFCALPLTHHAFRVEESPA